ncbi:MAG: hypothetical protein D3904_00875 [Candidatus Electrothrix sp. EH2]|nr:hypothetical protein [Candidatus Electrothrix sp. EH2]
MVNAEERYINLVTDYEFKKVFGDHANKELLLNFLNELLKDEQRVIRDLSYLKTEQLVLARKDTVDLCCENENGECFIVDNPLKSRKMSNRQLQLDKIRSNFARIWTFFVAIIIGAIKKRESKYCLKNARPRWMRLVSLDLYND